MAKINFSNRPKCPNPKCHKAPHTVKVDCVHNKLVGDKQRWKCQNCGSTFYAPKYRNNK